MVALGDWLGCYMGVRELASLDWVGLMVMVAMELNQSKDDLGVGSASVTLVQGFTLVTLVYGSTQIVQFSYLFQPRPTWS